MNFDNNLIVEHPFITHVHEEVLLAELKFAMKHKLPSHGNGRSRILRYGWDYTTDEWVGDCPAWIPPLTDCDSWTVNEYPIGHCISPHVDSLKFDDLIRILSLGVHTAMVFTSPMGEEKVVELPPRSLLSMRGEVRRLWKHSTLPTAEGVRYSIVYRKLKK